MNGARKANWQGMNWLRQDLRLALYIRDHFTCQYCGQDLSAREPGTISLDHLDSCDERERRGLGPDNGAANLVTACSRCNSSRGSKPWTEYAPGGAVERIQGQVAKDIRPYRVTARAILAGDVNLDVEALRGGAGSE